MTARAHQRARQDLIARAHEAFHHHRHLRRTAITARRTSTHRQLFPNPIHRRLGARMTLGYSRQY